MASGPGATAPVGRSIFDEHHPPAGALIDQCVHCGFCLPTCPTYALWHEEMDSPRGRIYLMKLGAEGEARLSDSYVGHFDHCLGCMACVTSCPSGVQYDKLIEATRAQIERGYRRPPLDRLFRRLIFALFPHPARLRALALALWVYQRSGARTVARALGVVTALPPRLQAAESLLPDLTLSALGVRVPRHVPARGERRRRVGLLLGCVHRVLFAGVNRATARVLAAEGCEVVVPRGQGCCGALMVHAGLEAEAVRAARRLIDAFAGASVDAIVTNAAGCGSVMKDYAHLLRDDPYYRERAQRFSERCRDVSEVLAELEPRAARHPLAVRAAYHDACHLQHAQNVRAEPRRALRSIPELEVVEIADAALCCGSAGIFNLIEPQAAQELGDRKVQNCLATDPDVIVSGNPGCLLQLRSGLARAGRPVPVLHTVELLDAALRGVPREALLGTGVGRGRGRGGRGVRPV